MKRHAWNKEQARKAGKKGGKISRPSTRYFSVNRVAAALAGQKSRYVPPQKPILDDTVPKADFERISGEYARLMPWEKLEESTRQFWRDRASALSLGEKGLILNQDHFDPTS